MQTEKPLLYGALICERIMHEEDGVNTLLRVIDTFDIKLPGIFHGATAQAQGFAVPLEFFLYTKWGGPVGPYSEQVKLIDTHDQEYEPWPVANFELRGGHYFQQIRHVMRLEIRQTGRYALLIYLNSDPFLDVPFQVNIHPSSENG